jgi:8-oxo-dGTP diphosphatase
MMFMHPDEQGARENHYPVIPRTLIFITKDNHILLLKGATTKQLWANKYNGIGGHIESGETPLQSAHRELQEETGLSVEYLDLRAVIHITMPQPPGIMLFVYVGETSSHVLSSSSEGTPEWVSKSEYLQLELVEDLYTLLPMILEPGPLLYGTYTLGDNGLTILLSSSAAGKYP